MEIVNFGSMNLDYVYTVPDFVQPGETLAADSRAIYCGGKGLNQSVAAARAGAVVRHAGMLGQGGEPLRAVLERTGVDTGLLADCPLPQGHTVIQVSRTGENCILLYRGSNGAVTADYNCYIAAVGNIFRGIAHSLIGQPQTCTHINLRLAEKAVCKALCYRKIRIL